MATKFIRADQIKMPLRPDHAQMESREFGNSHSHFHRVIQDSISLLTSEIVRLSKIPYRSQANINKIRTVDQQIEYLERLLAAYERDHRNYD